MRILSLGHHGLHLCRVLGECQEMLVEGALDLLEVLWARSRVIYEGLQELGIKEEGEGFEIVH